MLKDNSIIQALKSHKKAVFLIIASIVVVITTYSLVLPAFTLEKEKAEQQGGIDTENVSQNLSLKADNSENNDLTGADADSTGFEVKKAAKKEQNSSSDEEAKAENDKSEEKASDDKERDPGSSESAAKDEKDDDKSSGENLVIECEEKGIKTTLNYSDGSEIPEGTELAVNEITKKDKEYKRFISEAESAVDEANDSKHQKVISTIKLYDISLSLNGEEIEPEGDVNVSMDFEKGIKAGKDGDVRIIHFTEDEKGELKSEILEDKDVENEIKKDKLVGTEFTTDSFSV